MGLKGILKQFLPPIVVDAARWMLQRKPRARPPAWEFVPAGWRTHGPQTKGWDSESVVEVQKAKWPDFLRAVEGNGPLGVAHEAREITNEDPNAHNAIMTFGYVLARAGRDKARLSILDWGCGLGHYYLFIKALLPEVELDYHGRDLPLLSSAARTVLPEVTFHGDDDSCFRRRYDLVVAGGSLHYVEDWKSVARKLAKACKDCLLVARLPIVRAAPSFVVVQRPYGCGYDTEYLCWYLNRDEFLAHLCGLGMELVREFLNLDDPTVRAAPEQGEYRSFLFRPRTRGP